MNHVTVLLKKVSSTSSPQDLLDSQQFKILDLHEDPVALAWASYRRWRDHGNRWVDLHHLSTEPEDHAKSAEIRRYYADRIMISMLSKHHISDYRKKLYGVVTNTHQLAASDIGLLYRLPYFYMEDLAIDRVYEQCVTADQRPAERIVSKFEVIEQVFQSRRSGEVTQFWLRAHGSNAAYLLPIKTNNPFHRLVSTLFTSTVSLSAWAHVKTHRGYYSQWRYCQLSDIELTS